MTEMQKEAMPLIEAKLQQEVKKVFNQAVADFLKVMSQFMQLDNIKTEEFLSDIKVDLSYNKSTLFAYIIAGILIVPGIITSIVRANNWTYDEALEHLATEWSDKFERNVKYKVTYEVGK